MLRGISFAQSCSLSSASKHAKVFWKSGQQCSHTLHQRWVSLTVCNKKSHYEVLGLKKDASPSEIKDAFLRLSKEYHPDLNQTDPHTHEKFVKLHNAYQVLSKPQSRREYDVSIAHHFHFQQTMARHGYTSHYPSSDMPGGMGSAGPTYQGGEAENKQFWDETIYNMRKKSKGDFYPKDQYYGIRGVRKQSNFVVVIGCMVLISIGALLHYFAIRYSRHYSLEILDKKDRINLALLNESRARAKLYGNEHQIEELRAKLAAADKKRAAKTIAESESPS